MSKTSRVLKRFSLLREYNVLSEVKVTVDGQEHTFDKLLIGCFGILSLVTFDKKGELFGNEHDDCFILLTKNKTRREQTENLIKKARQGELVLRKILSDNEIYKIKIDTGIVIENAFCNAMIANDSIPVYTPQTLKKQLNCGKYDMDYKINVDAIVNAINKAK